MSVLRASLESYCTAPQRWFFELYQKFHKLPSMVGERAIRSKMKNDSTGSLDCSAESVLRIQSYRRHIVGFVSISLLTLSACQADENKAILSEVSANKVDLATQRTDTRPRLLTGQELKDALVGASFVDQIDQPHRIEIFESNGTHVRILRGEMQSKIENIYIVYDRHFCLHNKTNNKKISCTAVQKLPNESYNFLFDHNQFVTLFRSAKNK